MMDPERIKQVFQDPVAQELLHSAIPARLAYIGPDGYPRVIPVGFFWNGEQIVVCTSVIAPKVRSLARNPRVALTIDTNQPPNHILMVRGTAAIEIVDGVPDEYLAGSKKQVDPQHWQAFEAQVRGLYKQMARITIAAEWAKVLDFETRIPSFLEELIGAQSDA